MFAYQKVGLMGGSQNDDYTQNIFSNSQPLGPSPLIFIFLIAMIRQSRVGRSAKKAKKHWPERSKTRN